MSTEIKNIKRLFSPINLLVNFVHQIWDKIIANSIKFIKD